MNLLFPLGYPCPLGIWKRQLSAGVAVLAVHFYCFAGSGVALMSNFEQLLRGVWKPESNEILRMSL